MIKYDADKGKDLIICNCCGQMIAPADACDKTAFLSVIQSWGYFSKWDGCRHSFHLCENCYEKMAGSWVYPPDNEEETEIL